MKGPGDGGERGTEPPQPARRLASWLRIRNRVVRSADAADPVGPPATPEADRTARESPPPNRPRPQPEDDASVYPLF